MCRFVTYMGLPILLNEVIGKPKDSLISQSLNAREEDGITNGDGFGVAWYKPELDNKPGLFKSIHPAWNDLNLKSLIHHIIAPCFLAHVRAATAGGISQFNSHPFSYHQYCFLHNGGIGGFHKIKRNIVDMLDDNLYENIYGQTDSEYFFHLILQIMFEKKLDFDKAIMNALEVLEDLQKWKNIHEPNTINMFITDGEKGTAMRYSSNLEKEKAPTLYYSAGSIFTHTKEGCHMLPTKKHVESVIVASERLTDFSEEWHLIDSNSILNIDAKKKIETIKV